MQQPYARHLVLDQPQDQIGGRHGGLDAEQLEVLKVARVVAARDHALHAVLLAGDLADQNVVLVVAGHGDDQVGALDAGPLEHPQLRAVAVLRGVLELLLDGAEARPVVLDDRQLVALVDQLASQVPADLPGTDDDDVHLRGLPDGSLELVDRDLGGTHRSEPLLLVPPRTRGVEHTDDHLLHLETPLGYLGDHQVGVVPVRGRDKRVSPVDAGLEQGVDLERRPDREAPAQVLPGLRLALLELGDRLRVLVEHRDLVSLGEHLLRDAGANSAGADDHDKHVASLYFAGWGSGAGSDTSPPSSRWSPLFAAGAAVRITRHGAFSTT